MTKLKTQWWIDIVKLQKLLLHSTQLNLFSIASGPDVFLISGSNVFVRLCSNDFFIRPTWSIWLELQKDITFIF